MLKIGRRSKVFLKAFVAHGFCRQKRNRSAEKLAFAKVPPAFVLKKNSVGESCERFQGWSGQGERLCGIF